MSQTIGELTVKILLETAKAESSAGKLGGALRSVEVDAKASSQATKTLADKFVTLGLALGGVREVSSRISDTIRTMFGVFRQVNQSYQSFLSSARQLEATSKLTGANINVLRSTSSDLQSQFSLNANEANSLTIELTKLGQKAGDVSKVKQSVSALLDLGAGQGLNLEQTLVAVKQAVLGIDEGTDKLFQKNPSVLYEEYGRTIGKTVGKMSDQEKSQALLNALLDSGGKLTGQYSDYLNTAAGKQQLLNTRLEQAKITLGQQLNPAMLQLLDIANGLVRSFSSADSSSQELVIRLGLIGIAVTKLAPLIISLDKTFNTFGATVNNVSRSVPQSFGKIGTSAIGVFGKGGLVVTALLATLSIIDSILDKIEERKKEHDELMSRPTPAPTIPSGYKSENGVLVPDSSPSIINFETYKKASQEQGTQDPNFKPNSTKEEKVEKKGGSRLSNTKELNEQLNEEILLLREIAEVEKKIAANQDNIGALKDLNKELHELQKQLQYVKTGVEAIDFSNQLEGVSRSPDAMKEMLRDEKEKRIENEKEALGEIEKLKIEAITNTRKRQLAQFEYERQIALKEIEAMKIEEAIKARLRGLVNAKYDALINLEPESKADAIFNQSLSLASQISSVLGIGAETFAGKLLSGLQQGLSLANSFASLLSLILGSGSGGIFGMLGIKFASGGSVPGAGSGDTVPAMLTPGEFVIRKSVVGKLGTGFFEWLNGGGMLSSMVGKYANGGLVSQQSGGPAQVYIINPKLRGNDIELALKRTNKINSRRLT
jgi:hypothetical protein